MKAEKVSAARCSRRNSEQTRLRDRHKKGRPCRRPFEVQMQAQLLGRDACIGFEIVEELVVRRQNHRGIAWL